MSNYTISIPNTVYQKAQRLAKETAQEVDDLIRTRLTSALDQPMIDLPGDERAELQAMSYLSDDALWTIAREQLAPALQERMSLLMDRNAKGTITDDEYRTLSALVDRGQRLTLRKSQAMKLLLDRGYSITLDELKPPNE